jgi:hypothetical protein
MSTAVVGLPYALNRKRLYDCVKAAFLKVKSFCRLPVLLESHRNNPSRPKNLRRGAVSSQQQADAFVTAEPVALE